MTALTALLLLSQPAAPSLEPPALASGEFKRAVVGVRRSLAEGRFSDADNLLAVIPTQKVTVQWDDSAVPEGRRATLAAGRDRAFEAWKVSSAAVSATLASSAPDIKVSFVPQLPFLEGSRRRQAAVFFVNYAPGEPRVEAVISLERGLPPRPVDADDVGSETLHAIGLAIGLAPIPREGGAMGRVDAPWRLPLRMLTPELLTARENRTVVEELRRLAKARQKLPQPQEAMITLEQPRLQFGEAIQGGEMGLSLQVTNQGKSPLKWQVVPDCACFSLRYPREIAPGETGLLQVQVNTRDFPGPMNKALYVYTNDPEKPLIRLPALGYVKPVYRFLQSDPGQVLYLEPQGTSTTVYAVYDEERPWQILEIVPSGAEITASWEPWEGMLADPMFDEPARKRKGYKITLKMKPRKEPGRFNISLQVKTSDEDFGVIDTMFTAQSGIVSVPPSYYLGEVPRRPVMGWVQVVRPTKPFKVLKVTTDSEFLSAKAELMEDGSYRVAISFNGKAPEGTLSGTVILETDDPSQKKVFIPVAGIIR